MVFICLTNFFNMDSRTFLLKSFKKVYSLFRRKRPGDHQYFKYVNAFDQEANDLCYHLIQSGKPCMISKFGTIELSTLMAYKSSLQEKYSLNDWIDCIIGLRPTLWGPINIDALCSNAGFFPNDISLLRRFYDENLSAIKEIDVLGSYIYGEKMFSEELNAAKRVNLYGYYFPFLYKNPWTKLLKGKKVLVVHPFSEDIQRQYAKRELLFDDPDVLPEFTLITYKSVQSMLGIRTEYDTWFDALNKMKLDISKIDFDIALIGCGAYGMPLAAHIKRMGKQAVHLAGCTQLLFGIIGKRWEDLPLTKKYINEYWIHPSPDYIPAEARKIEGGCYW